ncbi:uncharacterized protein L969DRAFT_93133 [Mixia osmundae IAM 14324]|uniref:Uncharacterized protein n=1 Tax=Mixia osmundae (strain CBS 9802 / IAM 14324 / JCM 22182 / KY 12970) TaxID=764103 RepID=G7E603_MIXOS|nr:uncharacterized protein L969DRAFT_93133 [Mixia osmundae IAM 14324]KEI40589.1 hypothetical protein L969DRAFT_93133 [Mixia osmundae IAM 14324]GAA98263.1 hypothetical protein E5Q_04946 [Mixia osmundae IAM 14324]
MYSINTAIQGVLSTCCKPMLRFECHLVYPDPQNRSLLVTKKELLLTCKYDPAKVVPYDVPIHGGNACDSHWDHWSEIFRQRADEALAVREPHDCTSELVIGSATQAVYDVELSLAMSRQGGWKSDPTALCYLSSLKSQAIRMRCNPEAHPLCNLLIFEEFEIGCESLGETCEVHKGLQKQYDLAEAHR